MNIQLTDGRQCVYQWETGRYIKLVDFSACEVVNFFNPLSDEAYVVQTKMIDGILQAMIPNELLQLDKKIKLYATGTDSNGSFVEMHSVIMLVPRQKPLDYVYEPSEIMTFESVLAKASGYRDAAKASADAAKASENNAKSSETNAKSSAADAEKSKDAAKASQDASKKSEDAAKTSEDNAKASEDSAKDSENAAKDSAEAAKASEDNAKTSETNAKASEDAAKSSEESAEASKKAAAQSKTDAENAAETATQKAEEASTDADIASTKANEASESANDALADRKLAERYAKGTEDGTAVTSGTGYQDNAKWYSEQAKEAADSMTFVESDYEAL